MKVINLYGGPSSGKSTTAAGLFYLMKINGYKVELVTEYAKDMTYEQRHNILEDQLYIFAKQARRLKRLEDQVDFAVTDTSLLLSIIYNRTDNKFLNLLIDETYKKYYNIDIFVNRVKPYQQYGRSQTEKESKCLDKIIRNNLTNGKFDFIVDGDEHAPAKIMNWLRKSH